MSADTAEPASLALPLELPQIQLAPIEDFTPSAMNARFHPVDQVAQIKASIMEFGWVWPILRRGDSVIGAGHGRREAALAIFESGLTFRMFNGYEVPAGMLPYYDVSHWSEAKFKAYMLVDNRLAETSAWDKPKLELALAELADFNFDLTDFGFDAPDLESIFTAPDEDAAGGDAGELSENYSRKIEAPIYRITGEKPELADLADTTKRDELQAEIAAADLPREVAEFLSVAADRHVVFNFRNIAEFYAHADAPTQRLMEKSALVIIDFDKAIEQGFVRLSEGMMQQAEQSKAARDAE